MGGSYACPEALDGGSEQPGAWLIGGRCSRARGSPRRCLHMMPARFCALLTALLLPAVPVDLSSHHSCIGGAEKAHREL